MSLGLCARNRPIRPLASLYAVYPPQVVPLTSPAVCWPASFSAPYPVLAIRPLGLQVVVYYLIIFVLVNKRIQARGYQNM